MNYDAPFFSLDGLNTEARLVDIIDGDSIIAVVPVHQSEYKFHVRINGIDTCELKSKISTNKEKAITAKQRLFNLISTTNAISTREELRDYLRNNNTNVFLKCSKFDKYGRLLADVFFKEISIAELLLKENLAVEYHGGKKESL